MTDGFYKAFEDKYRGTRGLIKSRLHSYLPFIRPLDSIYPHSQTIDLGCGRGEWLELLGEKMSFNTCGVDIDEAMLKVCKKKGLHYKQDNALSYLKQLDNQSQTLVTAFHLVEHIPFTELQQLIQQAHRVLKPAGLLILETPNPENIQVGTHSFYMDPTHQQPLPPQLLAFLCEYYGFSTNKIIRLQERPELLNKEQISLLDVITGVSPDYAVVAQKKIPENLSNDIVEAFEQLLNKDYGLTLENLAQRFEQQLLTKVQQAEAKTQAALKQLQATEEKNRQTIEYFINSKSWRYTKPMRTLISLIKQFKHKKS